MTRASIFMTEHDNTKHGSHPRVHLLHVFLHVALAEKFPRLWLQVHLLRTLA
jgi:hypothetical protein